MSGLTRPKIDKVELQSLTLFNVSDHIVRGSEGKFGILLGNYNESRVHIYTSFETLISSSSYVDIEYLQKRYSQFAVIYPSYEIVGIYHISDRCSPNSLTVSILEQVEQFAQSKFPLICVIFDENEFMSTNSTNILQSFVSGSSESIKTNIRTNQSEYIATKTASNHRNYLSVGKSNDNFSDDTTTSQHKENISVAVNLIEEKVVKVLQYLKTNSEEEHATDQKVKQEINSLIVHLSERLNTIRLSDNNTSPDLQLELQTSHLSLLTEQLTLLDRAKAQMSRNTVLHGISNSSQHC